MGAKNKVISGDYEGKSISCSFGAVLIMTGFGNGFLIDKANVSYYEEIDNSTSKSATSAVARGAIGAALLGPIGLAAALSAKNKGVHLVALQFSDGKRSLVECDDKIYKGIVKAMF